MVKDPEFLAETKKRQVGGEPATGQFVQGVVEKTLNISPDLVKKMQKIAGFKS